MAGWYERFTAAYGGVFQLVVTRLGRSGRRTNVSVVRGVPTQFGDFSDADPFGDSTAEFTFPAISPFDDLDAPDLHRWLAHYSNVDLFWIPAFRPTAGYTATPNVINPLTDKPELIAPIHLRDLNGNITGPNRVKVWEGFIADLGFTADETSYGLTIQCQGALFQNDRYLAKPFFPYQPWPLERLIEEVFSHRGKPALRTRPLRVDWPAGWGLQFPPYSKDGGTVYTPAGKPGDNWSGYTSRETGAWDHALTGFVQDQLTVMITDERCGVATGNQWTVAHEQEQPGSSPGRQPVLMVRDRTRAPDFALWAGIKGVTLQLSGDSTQSENIIYGEGIGVDGTTWRNAVISRDGNRTDYLPLAASRFVYPQRDNPLFRKEIFVSEAYTKFGAGMDQPDGVKVAAQQLTRDTEPGWTGTITIRIDPSPTLSRWQIRAGMTVLLKGFAGSGEAGVPFHIASTKKSPMDGSVELTVDTRYRDLLTVAEAQQRTRDPLTPIKMLQVNRNSVMIEDIQVPWDYHAGSGYIPRSSRFFDHNRPRSVPFPYTSWRKDHPPRNAAYADWYVEVRANASDSKKRWSHAVPIFTAEKGTIARTEIYACYGDGSPAPVPFHVSFYKVWVDYTNMPDDGHNYSAFINNAFEQTDPETGQPWPQGSHLAPDPTMIIGWGNQVNGVMNRAGFYPGREDAGSPCTGIMIDDSTWTFDNSTTENKNYDYYKKPGSRVTKNDRLACTIYAMFYCEADQPVFFQGRLFRQNPGSDG